MGKNSAKAGAAIGSGSALCKLLTSGDLCLSDSSSSFRFAALQGLQRENASQPCKGAPCRAARPCGQTGQGRRFSCSVNMPRAACWQATAAAALQRPARRPSRDFC